MAIKVSTTEIITDSSVLQNFNSMQGNYTGLYPNANSITTVIDMDTPIMLASLSANRTFTVTNAQAGKTAVLLLDIGSNGYTPTFPSSFKWAEDTQPSWTGTRYWQIGLTAWDSSTVRVIATGYSGSGATAPTIDLGSTINTYSSGSNLGGYARTTLAIGASGTIATSGTGTSGATSGTVSRTWLLSGSASDYQIKWDGTGDTGYLISNSGLGTWLNGGVNHSWVIEEDDNDSVTRSVSGTLSIRDTATSTVQDTVSVTISADFSP
jgi:hypothetical protein